MIISDEFSLATIYFILFTSQKIFGYELLTPFFGGDIALLAAK
ncbi:hypothetical protein NSP_47360 [Nodularia spumigena CCY9414]|nr:hypothetical protein NSP_47360 [Nodularia spumigena CCY9414]